MTYTGQWFIFNNKKAGNGGVHFSNDIGNSVSFTFTGTKFIFGYTSDQSQGVVQILIDGKINIYYSEFEPELAWRRSWSSPTLSNGTHNVIISHVLGNQVDIDYIIVQP